MKNIEKVVANKLRAGKDIYMVGIAYILTKLRIRANYITISGVIFMLLFIASMPVDLRLSLFFFVASLLCDSLDGVVARYQKSATDRGKFIDVFSDDLNTFLFVAGVAFGQLANTLYLIPFVYFTLLSRSLRVFIHSYEFESDWLFRPVAGFLHNMVNYFAYTSFVLVALNILPMGMLNYVFISGSVILCTDALLKFNTIIKINPEQ
jgi:phosphatidylglycerophosphate synthase